MSTYIALLRGINVGGSKKLPMAELRDIALALGWVNPRTYIASGNLVFEAEGAPEDLALALQKALPLDVPVLVVTAQDLIGRLDTCPFEPEKGNLLHAFFCTDTPVPDQELIAQFQTTEELCVIGKTLWLHTPDGFSNSKLSDRLDKLLAPVTYTARNLNTVRKLVDMAGPKR